MTIQGINMVGEDYTIMICMLLVVLAIYVSFSTLFEARRDKHRMRREDNTFLDEEGYHSYYERSIIKKKEFLRSNPFIRKHELRTLRRLLHLITRKRENRERDVQEA